MALIDVSTREIFDEDLAIFRDSVRTLFARELVPHLDRFDAQGLVDRSFWRACGDGGLLCPTVRPENGGLGLDFRYNAVVLEELVYAGSAAGIPLQNDVTADYIEGYGSSEQKRKYLPGMISGEIITAIAMTEPGGGSDLQGIRTTARRDGDSYVINGSKIYITNGQSADLVIVVAKTDPALGARGISLLLVEGDTPGFRRGRNLDKVGQHSADTSELFFEDVRIPLSQCLGDEGRGFHYLVKQLPQERLSIAISAQAAAQRAFDEAVAFTRERTAFGQKVIDFQNSRFALAEMKTELQIGWSHLDWAIARHVRGELTAEEASVAKLWHSEMQGRLVDMAVQLHGGAGYMKEYMVARLWCDARISRIYGGTSEIMKEMIGRSIRVKA